MSSSVLLTSSKELSSEMLITNYLLTAKTATAKIYHAKKQKCLFTAMI